METILGNGKAMHTCNRCGATWDSKSSPASDKYKYPKNCAKCKSPYWNKPRIRV